MLHDEGLELRAALDRVRGDREAWDRPGRGAHTSRRLRRVFARESTERYEFAGIVRALEAREVEGAGVFGTRCVGLCRTIHAVERREVIATRAALRSVAVCNQIRPAERKSTRGTVRGPRPTRQPQCHSCRKRLMRRALDELAQRPGPRKLVEVFFFALSRGQDATERFARRGPDARRRAPPCPPRSRS